MGRLRTLPARLQILPPRLASQPQTAPEKEKQRNDFNPLRALYKTGEWARLRLRVFRRDLFTCQWPGCGRIHVSTKTLTADHRKPHRGDLALFWDETNIQTMCTSPCHSKHKQRLEQGSEWR